MSYLVIDSYGPGLSAIGQPFSCSCSNTVTVRMSQEQSECYSIDQRATADEEISESFLLPLFGTDKRKLYTMITGPTSDGCSNNNPTTLVSFTRQRENVSSSVGDRLFVDDLWPGCFVLADYLCLHQHLCTDRNVVELGAGNLYRYFAALEATSYYS